MNQETIRMRATINAVEEDGIAFGYDIESGESIYFLRSIASAIAAEKGMDVIADVVPNDNPNNARTPWFAVWAKSVPIEKE